MVYTYINIIFIINNSLYCYYSRYTFFTHYNFFFLDFTPPAVIDVFFMLYNRLSTLLHTAEPSFPIFCVSVQPISYAKRNATNLPHSTTCVNVPSCKQMQGDHLPLIVVNGKVTLLPGI